MASMTLVETYGISDAKDRKEVRKACLKYFRARALLDAQFGDKTSADYQKRSQVLEREYGKELRKVLPQS